MSRAAFYSDLSNCHRSLLAVHEYFVHAGVDSSAQKPGVRDDRTQQVLQLCQLRLLLLSARLVYCR